MLGTFSLYSLSVLAARHIFYTHLFLHRRVALHKYDPPDLVTNVDNKITNELKDSTAAAAVAETPAKLPQADFIASPALEDTTPVSVATADECSPLQFRSRSLDFDEDDESDDDLL